MTPEPTGWRMRQGRFRLPQVHDAGNLVQVTLIVTFRQQRPKETC